MIWEIRSTLRPHNSQYNNILSLFTTKRNHSKVKLKSPRVGCIKQTFYSYSNGTKKDLIAFYFKTLTSRIKASYRKD